MRPCKQNVGYYHSRSNVSSKKQTKYVLAEPCLQRTSFVTVCWVKSTCEVVDLIDRTRQDLSTNAAAVIWGR
ncbi:hypothetical protein Y032_0147g2580 [Ancylostoma ceylanicum]|nr:hypothetical protein Y032_0147g2580 [Ancylostoma ceylanicum]